ncbi:MAG: hypothetical protein ACI3V3_01825, partial [Faecousia sp.]
MKSKTMKLSALLLVLVMVTACFVGGTFAKYVREAVGADGARAAKWGVTIEPNGNLFSNTYVTDDPIAVTAISNSVASTDRVVAPGTSGNLDQIVLGGSPEVAVAVSYTSNLELTGWTVPADGSEPVAPATGHWEADGNGWVKTMNIGAGTDVQPDYTPTADGVADGTNAGETYEVSATTGNPVDGGALWKYTFVWVVDNAPAGPAVGDPVYYCPIVITVGSQTFSGLDYASAADFEYAVQAAINAYSAQYEPGTDLSTVPVPVVSWAWAFEGNNVKDTALGDQAAAG